jgi:hypothetical protein
MLLELTVIMFAAVVSPTPTPVPPAKPGLAAMAPHTSQPVPRGRSLADVAKGVKLRFPENKPTVITNESLKELSAGAELTTATAAPPPDASPGGALPEEQQQAEKKTYWQQRYFAAQREVATLDAEEKRLSAEVSRLEREFYARDDPYQRDGVIKPAWDDAVAKLRDVQRRQAEARSAPEAIANEARRDGALPGWFREAPPPVPAPGREAKPQS